MSRLLRILTMFVVGVVLAGAAFVSLNSGTRKFLDGILMRLASDHHEPGFELTGEQAVTRPVRKYSVARTRRNFPEIGVSVHGITFGTSPESAASAVADAVSPCLDDSDAPVGWCITDNAHLAGAAALLASPDVSSTLIQIRLAQSRLTTGPPSAQA